MPINSFSKDKFTLAVLPEICAPRRALIAHFHRASEARFIYVGSDAGSGKTVSTLLWLDATDRNIIWIGLDKYDNTPSIFYKQLAHGIFSVQPNNEAMRTILENPTFSALPIDNIISMILEMTSNNAQYALVFDDMHLIRNDKIFKSLPAVLRRLPSSFVTIILSRDEISQEFEPLIKSKKISIITDEKLRFTVEEIHQYYMKLGLFVSLEDCQAIFSHTNGLAMSVNVISKSNAIPKNYNNIFSEDFEAQVWNQWSAKLRDFCLCTAVVDEFNVELARDLSGREDAEEILESLSSTNSFLSHLHENTYQYNHLFHDFLREQLIASNMDKVTLCKKAAFYYKQQEDYSNALLFWIESGDFKGIDHFLFLFLFQNHRGSVSDLADFLSKFFATEFPKRAYEEAPTLHVLSVCYYYIVSKYEEYAYHMDAILEKFPLIAKADSKFVEFSLLALIIDHRITLIRKAEIYSMFAPFLVNDIPTGFATSIASFSLNLPYIHRSNIDYSELAEDPVVLPKINKSLGLLFGSEWEYLSIGLLACLDYEKNRLSHAFDCNEQAIACFLDNHKIEGLICLLTLKHSILWQMNKFKEAAEVMEKLTDLTKSSAQFFTPNLKAYKAKLTIFDGDITVAKQWLDEYFVVETQHIELYRAFSHFTTARAYMAIGETAKAQQLLFMLKEYGDHLNRPLDKSEAGVLLSAIYWMLGKKKEATAEMEEVLKAIQSYDYIRIIADEGNAVLPILKRIFANISKDDYNGGLNRSYVSEIIFATFSFSQNHKGYLKDRKNLGESKPIKLSKQQKRVVSLLAKGYNNVEISSEMKLNISTVKCHIYLAYQKLGTKNAIEAVVKARELGLL